MVKPKHIYRKGYENRIHAERSADGFSKVDNIDKLGPAKVWFTEDNGTFYVYVELAGDMDPKEVFSATGFEQFI